MYAAIVLFLGAIPLLAQSTGGNEYEKGKKISGFELVENANAFHAGTLKDNKGDITTNGGRVIAVTAMNAELKNAVETAIANADKINFEGMNSIFSIVKELIKECI